VSHTHARACGALCCGPVHRQRRRPVSHPPEDDDDDNNNNIIIIRETTTTKCVSVVPMKYNNLTVVAFGPVSNCRRVFISSFLRMAKTLYIIVILLI
jgi:hypothetical protein